MVNQNMSQKIKETCHRIIKIEYIQDHQFFLAQRAQANSLLAVTKTQEEFLEIMQKLSSTKMESSSSKVEDFVSKTSSIHFSTSFPLVDLGNNNEDDCKGIFPLVI